MKTRKPARLTPGDTVGLISPASPVTRPELITESVTYIEGMQLRVKLGAHTGSACGYLAGSDEERVGDIHSMFLDKDVKAVFCLRGGYGSGRLLEQIDYRIIKKHPKLFIGYSDITALHMAFLTHSGLPGISGPMPAVDFRGTPNEFTTDAFWELVMQPKAWRNKRLPAVHQMECLAKGKAEGVLLGGNLALITSLIGTPYVPDFRNKILFLEEVGEAPYRVDRMLNQLKLSGILRAVAGIVLGAFTDCSESEPEKPTLELEEIFLQYFGELGKPVLTGYPHGHIAEFPPLVYGASYKLNSGKKSLSLSEDPFS
jgi:muramoyltetrapeptide carboxypeptidase